MAAIDRDKILEAAQKLVEKKRFDKAIVEYQRLLQSDPKDVRTLLKVGDLHLKIGEYLDAVGIYERVGEHYASQGFALKAIAVFKQVREIIAKHASQHEDKFAHIVPRLAELYTQLGLTSDALATFDEYATRLLKAGRDRDAIDVFKKVVALEPSNPLPHLRLGEAYIRVKEVDAAMERFGTAAEILLRLGRKDDALRVVERVLQYRQEGRFARLAAEVLLDRAGPNDGMAALQKLQIAFKENRRDLETLSLLARAFDLLGQGAKAIEVLKESASIAKEANNLGMLGRLVETLQQRAPDDEQVRAYARELGGVAESAPPPPDSAAPLTVQPESAAPSQPAVPPRRTPQPSAVDIEVEVEEEELEVDEQEEPFALRASQPHPSATNLEVAARASQWLHQAEKQRRTRSWGVVAQTLRAGIAELPDVRELRQRLFDVLIEASQQESAIAEMIAWSRHLVGRGRAEEAAQQLDEVLLLEPNHAEARQLLAHLGYAVPIADPTTGSSRASYVEDAPLPSYDLEGVGARNVLPPTPAYGAAPYPAGGGLDEPFDQARAPLPSFEIEEEATAYVPPQPAPAPPPPPAPAPRAAPAPAPSQPTAKIPFGGGLRPAAAPRQPAPAARLVAPGVVRPRQNTPAPPRVSQTPAAPVTAPSARPAATSQVPAHPSVTPAPPAVRAPAAPQRPAEPAHPTAPPHAAPAFAPPAAAAPHAFAQPAAAPTHPPVSTRAPDPPRAAQLDEDALEEVEFFAQHGMFDEARALLDAELKRLPNHPLLMERLREIEALAQATSTSGTRVVPRREDEIAAQSAPYPTAPAQEDRAFDIAASLDLLDSLEAPQPEGPIDDGTQQVSVETVFEAFKAGVAKTISESDAATHYDLGVAYREMGLYMDAINEFQVAARDPARECVCLSMVGMIHMQLGNPDAAIDAWLRGLHASVKSREQEMALLYEVADASEARGNPDQALYYFERAAHLDPSYRDPRGAVVDRVRRLKPAPQAAKPAARAVNSGDEFDSAFDDLFSGKKLP